MLSYLIFTKPLTEQHGTGLLLIAMGIILKMLPEHKPANTRKSLPSSPTGNNQELRATHTEHAQDEQERRPLV